MTPERIAEIRAQMEASTVGPLRTRVAKESPTQDPDVGIVDWTGGIVAECFARVTRYEDFNPARALANATFFAGARDAVYELLEHIAAVERADEWAALMEEIRAWQRVTFPRATPASVAEHLRREAEELVKTPSDVEEMADVFFLLVAASDGHDLLDAVRAKFAKNLRRTWREPDASGVVEHASEGDA